MYGSQESFTDGLCTTLCQHCCEWCFVLIAAASTGKAKLRFARMSRSELSRMATGASSSWFLNSLDRGKMASLHGEHINNSVNERNLGDLSRSCHLLNH